MLVLCIKAARINSGMTLIQAADRLGINKDTLCRLERDSTNIQILLARKMSEIYEVPEEQLFFGAMSEFLRNKKIKRSLAR